MNWLEAILLGVIQGLTEFLPVSSSGHLRLVGGFWKDMPSDNALFEIFLHGITLLIVVIVLRKQVVALLKSPQKMGIICLSAVPTVVLVLIFDLKDHFEHAGIRFVLMTEAITGVFLVLSEFISRRLNKGPFLSKPLAAIIIGTAQGLAVLPGLSRSGLTLGTAFLLGWSREEAFEFSFLMSLPVIAGAVVLSGKDLIGNTGQIQLSWLTLACGALPAAFFGAATLILLRSWVLRSLNPFGVYCLVISGAGFLYLGGV